MCSSSLGPASAPSFVTWPTRTTVVVPRLQASTISVATARTWLTLPGRPSALSDVNVCTESTISRSGAPSPSSNGSTSSTRDVDNASKLSCSIPRRLARSLICGNDSSPLAYRTSLPEAATAPAICNKSVDLPMPGSPPMSRALPGTSPLPSTRSSASSPVPNGSCP